MVKSWTEQKERSNPFTLRLIRWVALHLSRSFARFWLYPITCYFFLTSPRVRFASRQYLRRVLGKTPAFWHVLRHIHAFSSTVLDRVYFLTDQHRRFVIDFESVELIDELAARQQAAILLGSHVGSFDALRCLGISHYKLPLKILMHLEHNAMITKAFDELNPELAKSVIDLADSNAMLKVSEAVQAGSMVGILGDRVQPGEKSIHCQLLGDTISLPAGPVSLALVLKVPIVLFFGVYLEGNRYKILFKTLSTGDENSGGDRKQKVEQLTCAYTSEIENIIRAYPYNWFNFYDYWGDDEH